MPNEDREDSELDSCQCCFHVVRRVDLTPGVSGNDATVSRL